ncbi:hypothetical protein TTHT_1742 [Thermotomaculum hydrothermale]|uniref:AAA+ ATPase domain-containing protein n=1 Tax=Thermotomaculum hydrothermale TaxID=981385 RepID=A0A7R6PGA7_9BACT|nr:ATP-binding protein [Thermotomaculum hydrothermale]BBB33213.1 hypothetical protein TTHT_1742 [Thermotomaculum hydrothermale]
MEFDLDRLLKVFKNQESVEKGLKESSIFDFVSEKLNVSKKAAFILCYTYYLQLVYGNCLTVKKLLDVLPEKGFKFDDFYKEVINLIEDLWLYPLIDSDPRYRSFSDEKDKKKFYIIPRCILSNDAAAFFHSGKIKKEDNEQIIDLLSFFDRVIKIFFKMSEHYLIEIDRKSVLELHIKKLVKRLWEQVPYYQVISTLPFQDLVFLAKVIYYFTDIRMNTKIFVSSIRDILQFYKIANYFREGNDNDFILVKSGILERKKDDRGKIYFKLSSQFINDLIGRDYVDEDDEYSDLLEQISKIDKKELFYNKDIHGSVKELERVFKQRNFKKLVSTYKKSKLNSGITVLFYGHSGTGKTELALQLARSSGRKLLKLNLEQVFDMWVGESEKNVKRIFNEYRRIAEQEEKKPILLLNEIDALLGKRGSVNGNTGRMSNNVVNVFLNEFENFDGILIATTNLIDEIDNAFFRRFHFKIKFDFPEREVRMKIWISKLNGLKDETYEKLSSFYLTGGEIDNVIRKFIIASTLNNSEEIDEIVLRLAKEEAEFKGRNKSKREMGFKIG